MPSEKVLQKKQKQVQELVEKYKNAQCIVFSDYLGLTVEEDTQFRAIARENDVDYKVVKNRLILLAMKELGIDGLESVLKGPTAVALSQEDVIAPAKISFDADKKYKKFAVKGGVMEGKVVTLEDVKALADLPSKEELIAKVVGGLNAPIYGFANVLNANLKGLVVALNAITEKKQAE